MQQLHRHRNNSGQASFSRCLSHTQLATQTLKRSVQESLSAQQEATREEGSAFHPPLVHCPRTKTSERSVNVKQQKKAAEIPIKLHKTNKELNRFRYIHSFTQIFIDDPKLFRSLKVAKYLKGMDSIRGLIEQKHRGINQTQGADAQEGQTHRGKRP